MKTEHFNGLTEAQAERLAYAIEEMAEAQKAACKILRHGYSNYDPTIKRTSFSDNRRDFEREIGDVLNSMDLLFDAADISRQAVSDFANEASVKCRKWMRHQEQIEGAE